MEKYESKQQQIRQPAELIYRMLSDFTLFTPIVSDKVDDWSATEDSCSFKVKGMTVRLGIIDKAPFEYIKIGGGENGPLDFTFWVQLREVAPYDTRMKLTLQADLNMMMKMMVGGKLKKGIDRMAEMIADAFNGKMPGNFDPEQFASAGFGMYGFETEEETVENIPADVLDMDDLPEECRDYPLNFPDPNKPAS